MSENDALQVSCCGRHGIVGCERCFGSYRVVRPMVRQMSEEMVKSPTEKLDDIAASIARLGEALADARAYKPCEPCLRDDHDNCTGDCSSMCCALADAERERDSALADLAALRGRVEEAVRLHTRMERGDGCRYCDYNDDMGGNGWPCPTVAILAPEGERE